MSLKPEHRALLVDVAGHYAKKWAEFQADPFTWLWDAARTLNKDALPGQPRELAPFPDLPYIRTAWSLYFSEKYLLEDKSRQLMFTWLANAGLAYEAQFLPNITLGYQNTTTAIAARKVEDCFLYILRNQPLEVMMPWVEGRGQDAHPPDDWVQEVARGFDLNPNPTRRPPPGKPETFGSDAYEFARLLCHTYTVSRGTEGIEDITLHPHEAMPMPVGCSSTLLVIPGGSNPVDKWRSETFYRAMHDEVWFYQRAQEAVNSAKQTIGKTGKQLLVTTAFIGYDDDGYPKEMAEGESETDERLEAYNSTGVWARRNKLGYTHLRVHYTADPYKRRPEWRAENVRTRNDYRELEISYDVPDGDPFYSSFSEALQLVQVRRLDESARLLLGQDGGRNPATVVSELNDEGRVIVTKEITSENMGVKAHGRKVVNWLDAHYPSWRNSHTLWCDPSMWQKSESSDESAAAQLMTLGFNCRQGIQDPDVRFDAVQELCIPTPITDTYERHAQYGFRPKLVIDAHAAPVLTLGLKGACDIDKGSALAGMNRKTKNMYSHVCEALEYLATGLPRVSSRAVKPFKSHQPKRRRTA